MQFFIHADDFGKSQSRNKAINNGLEASKQVQNSVAFAIIYT